MLDLINRVLLFIDNLPGPNLLDNGGFTDTGDDEDDDEEVAGEDDEDNDEDDEDDDNQNDLDDPKIIKDDSMMVELENGEKVTIEELKQGNMNQKRYTQAMQEVSQKKRQLELAANKGDIDDDDKKDKVDELEQENKEIQDAIDQMDDDDALKPVLKGIFRQNNRIIKTINDQITNVKQSEAQAAEEENIEFFKRVTKETLNEESKNYNLPETKVDGEKINFKEVWQRNVRQAIVHSNEEMTLPEYKAFITRVGKAVYKELRPFISMSKTAKKSGSSEGDIDEDAEDKKSSKSRDKSDTKTRKSRSIKPTGIKGLLNIAVDKRWKTKEEED